MSKIAATLRTRGGSFDFSSHSSFEWVSQKLSSCFRRTEQPIEVPCRLGRTLLFTGEWVHDAPSFLPLIIPDQSPPHSVQGTSSGGETVIVFVELLAPANARTGAAIHPVQAGKVSLKPQRRVVSLRRPESRRSCRAPHAIRPVSPSLGFLAPSTATYSTCPAIPVCLARRNDRPRSLVVMVSLAWASLFTAVSVSPEALHVARSATGSLENADCPRSGWVLALT